jgi:O-antigen ligase/Flp pilus assembly protein TadD
MPAAPILPLDSLAPSRSRWDLFFEVVLAALLAFMPFALGAVEAWSELVVVGAATVLAAGVFLRAAFDRSFRPFWTWAYVPLLLFVLLAAVQLLPLPAGLLESISPPTCALRHELLGPDTPAGAAPISMYPLATTHGLRMALAAAAIFLTVASVFRSPAAIKRLLLWILIVGVAQAVLALLQIFTFADRIHWLIDVGTRVTSGSFINYSNFSQFMNLSIGAGLALLLVRLHEQRRLETSLGGFGLQENGALMAGLVVCAISVFTSMSRNGAISLVVAAAIVGTALFRKGTLSRRGWLLAMVPLGTLAILLLVAFDTIYARLSTLQHESNWASRWQLTQDVLRAWRTFPVWGSGLGTHEFVFPMFDTAQAPVVAQNADNDYAQLLEETGIAGAACMAAFLGVVMVALVKLCRRGRTALSAAAFGLAFGVIAVGIHSATDFGQRLPAVFCLSAITCALALRLSRWEAEANRKGGAAVADWHVHTFWPRILGGAGAACVLVIGGWALRDNWAACRGETWRYASLVLENRIQQDVAASASVEQLDEDYGNLLDAAVEAASSEPGNVVYGYWLNLYRWQSASRTHDPSTGQTIIPREGLPAIEQIADSLTSVRQTCPTYGPPYALEGLLRLTILGQERGRELIKSGLRLAPYDPAACMTAADIAANEERFDDAANLLTRAVKLQPGYFDEAAQRLMMQVNRPEAAEQLADGDYERLSRLASICQSSARYSMLAADFQQKAEAALREKVAGGSADAQELAALASIEVRDSRLEEAIELYRRAIAIDYKQVQWHLGLARCLADAGHVEEAVHEAKICLRLRPEDPEAKALIEKLGTGKSP